MYVLDFRLVVTILDAFPFDLSGTKEIHNFPVLPENADEKAETTLGNTQRSLCWAWHQFGIFCIRIGMVICMICLVAETHFDQNNY